MESEVKRQAIGLGTARRIEALGGPWMCLCHPVDALEWLEREKGIHWGRTAGDGSYYAQDADGTDALLLEAPTASGLLDAILSHMEPPAP